MLLPPTPLLLPCHDPALVCKLCLQLLVLISSRTHARMTGAPLLLLLLLPVLLPPTWPAPAAAMPGCQDTELIWPASSSNHGTDHALLVLLLLVSVSRNTPCLP